MNKENIKKKLSFKKTFVANLNREAAQSIKGGEADTVRSSDCSSASYNCGGGSSGGILICDIIVS